MADAERKMEDKDWEAFFRSGFLLRWNNEEWLVGHTEGMFSNRHKQSGQLYTPDFFLEEPNNWRSFAYVFRVPHEEMEKRFPKTRARLGWIWNEPSGDLFMEQVLAMRQEMDKLNLDKAVPIVFSKARYEVDRDVKDHLLRHVINAPYQMGYGYWSEQSGIMGITPELLFEMNETELNTMALASTGEADGPSLLEDEKEMKEHQLVVEDIIRQFKDEKTFETSKTLEWNVGHIKHLLTLIKVKLESPKLAGEIIKKLHPTPALGVAPREFGYKWLKRFDPGRARFGAPFGYTDYEGVTRVLVAIRNIQWSGGEVQVGAGCGFLPMSNEQKEWQEIHLKLETVMKNLGL